MTIWEGSETSSEDDSNRSDASGVIAIPDVANSGDTVNTDDATMVSKKTENENLLMQALQIIEYTTHAAIEMMKNENARLSKENANIAAKFDSILASNQAIIQLMKEENQSLRQENASMRKKIDDLVESHNVAVGDIKEENRSPRDEIPKMQVSQDCDNGLNQMLVTQEYKMRWRMPNIKGTRSSTEVSSTSCLLGDFTWRMALQLPATYFVVGRVECESLRIYVDGDKKRFPISLSGSVFYIQLGTGSRLSRPQTFDDAAIIDKPGDCLSLLPFKDVRSLDTTSYGSMSILATIRVKALLEL